MNPLSFMRFSVFAAALLGLRCVQGTPRPRRTTPLFFDHPALPELPDPTNSTLNLTNIQADILVGMHKDKELFFFFTINDAGAFKAHLAQSIHPLITNAFQALDRSLRLQPITMVNIAFSQSGLNILGLDGNTNAANNLGDTPFSNGQFSDAEHLGDANITSNWVSAFTGTAVHGVFLLASDDVANINDQLNDILAILGDSIIEKHRLQGEVRPGPEEGHEHFGFMDGISQPAIIGFTDPVLPGPDPIDPGHLLLNGTGDNVARPTWAKDGSFLAFRQLKQLVPEFNQFLTENALSVPGLTKEQGAELLGARMVGRWKSGAPIDLSPLADNATLANDTNMNNNFTFFHVNEDIRRNETRCPFSAHIRKTNPRADFSTPNKVNRIFRASIPYGPEVTDAEKAARVSDPSVERGLAFVAYQSRLDDGFRFLQTAWANNPGFFPQKSHAPGVDPIIGALNGRDRDVFGLDRQDPNRNLTMKDFIVSRGGEYFFSPSLSAILDPIAT